MFSFVLNSRYHHPLLNPLNEFLSASWTIPSPLPLFFTSTPVYLKFIFHDPIKHHLPHELFPKPIVLVDSGCSNKTPQIAHTYFSAFWRLRIPRSRHGWIQWLIRTSFLVPSVLSGKGVTAFWSLCYKGTNPIRVLSSIWLFAAPWTIYSLPGSSVQGIFQTKILEWVAIFYSRGLS